MNFPRQKSRAAGFLQTLVVYVWFYEVTGHSRSSLGWLA